MKCSDCKHYYVQDGVRRCSWHYYAILNIPEDLDSAEKDCRGFEKR